MDYRQKRKLSFLTIGLIFLLSGIEYGKQQNSFLFFLIKKEIHAANHLFESIVRNILKKALKCVNGECIDCILHINCLLSLFLSLSQLSFCQLYGDICSYQRHHLIFLAWVYLHSASVGWCQVQCLVTGQTRPELQRTSFSSPMCLKLWVSTLEWRWRMEMVLKYIK